jgi:translocation-and-assembly-module (TAM) inner membrane subunit TamB-like protein
MTFRGVAIFIFKRLIPIALVVVAVALLLFLLFFDSIAQSAFKDAIVEVPGDLKVRRFSPSFDGVTLSGVQWTLDSKEPIFEASEISLDLDFRSLVGQDWSEAVRRVTIRKPGLRVTVDPNGNVNLMSLLPATPTTPVIDIASVRTEIYFQDGWILYNDRRASGFLYELADWSGELFLADGKTLQFRTSGKPNAAESSLLGLNGEVSLDQPELATVVTLQQLDLEPFTGFPGFGPGLTYLRGTVDGSVRASGKGENWTDLLANLFLVGEVSLGDGALRSPWMPASFTELVGQAKLLGSEVSTEEFQGEFADIGFRLSGHAEMRAGGQLEGDLTTKRFDLAKLNSLLAEPLPIQGEARAEVSARGTLDNMLLSGSLFGYDLEAEGQTVSKAQADFLLTEEMVYLPDISASTAAGDVSGEGWVFLGDEIRVLFEMRGDDTHPEELLPGIAQRADFKVKVLGDPTKPTVYGQGRFSQLGEWAQGLSEAEGKFIFSGDDLMLYEGQALSGSSVVNLDIGSYSLRTKQFSGLLSAFDFRAQDLPGIQGLTGLFSGQAMVQADLSGETPKVEAQAVLSDGQFQSGDLAVSGASGEMYFDGTRVVVPRATSTFRGSQLEVSGVYDTRNSGLNFSLRSPNFNLNSLGLPAEQANLAASVEGRLDGDLGVYGLAQTARGKAALSGFRRSSGHLSGVAWLDGVHQGMDLQTVVVADGTTTNLNFDYTGRVEGKQLAGLGPLDIFGAADLVGNTLRVRPTLLSGADAKDSSIYPLTTYSGAAYSFFGPLMGRPLEKVVIEESPFPTTRSITVAGNANLGSGALDLKYQLRAAKLEEAPFPPQMEAALPFELLGGYGTADGEVLGTISQPKVGASFHFPYLLLGRRHTENRLSMAARGRMALGRRIVEVPSLTVSETPFDSRLRGNSEVSGDGLLGISGVFKSDSSFDVRLKTEGFSPTFLAFFAPQQFARWVPSGRLSTESLHLWGTVDRPSLAGQMRLLRGGVMLAGEPYPINSAFIDFSSQSGEVRVPELGLTAPGLDVKGSLKMRTGGQLEGAIRADDIDLARLERFDPLLGGLEGTGDLAVNLGGSYPSSPQLEVGFKASNATWNPKVMGGRDRAIPIEALVLGVFEEDRLASGLTIAPSDDGIFLELPSNGFLFQRSSDGLRIAASGAVSIPFGGMVAANFKTFRSLADYFASPVGPDFGRQGTPFQLAIDNLTTAEAAKLTGRSGQDVSLATGITLSLEGQWWRDHKADAGDSLPNYNLAFNKLNFQSGPSGRRSGFGLNHPGTINYQREGTAGFLSLKDFEIGFFRQEPAATEGSKDAAPAKPTTVREGVVNAEGSLAITRLAGTEPESRFTVDAEKIPLANLAFLLPESVPLAGILQNLELQLSGVLPSPKLTLLTEVSDFALGPVTGMKIDGSITAFETGELYRIVIGEEEDEGIKVTFADDDETVHGGKIDGEADLRWVEDPTPDRKRLELFAKNLSVSLDSPLRLIGSWVDKDLSVLAGIVPGKVSSSGTFEASLAATGTLERPEFEGKATLEDGRFDSKLYGTFEELNLDAELTRITRQEAQESPVLQAASSGFLTRFQLHRLGGKLGSKPFFGGGIAEFAGIAPTLLDLHVVGESLPVKLPDLFVGQLDLHLELDGKKVTRNGRPALRPELTGLLVFPQGEFKIPLGSISSDDPSESIKDAQDGVQGLPLDVTLDLNLGSEFFVNALNSRVRTVGDLQVKAVNGVTEVYGKVALSRGLIRIPFYDASFRVRQGYAIFDGPLIPRLDAVEAVADIGTYRVTARANGRYPDTLSLKLYSDPPLPQAELSRMAILGGLPPGLSGNSQNPNQAGALGTLGTTGASFLSGVLTNRLTEQIGNLFFLSELSFDYIPPATYAIKVAKSLDPNDRILLTLTRVIRDSGLTENLYGIEWRITNQLLVRTAFDQLSRVRFWLQSINRF